MRACTTTLSFPLCVVVVVVVVVVALSDRCLSAVVLCLFTSDIARLSRMSVRCWRTVKNLWANLAMTSAMACNID